MTLNVNLSDGDGSADIVGAHILLSPSLSISNACLIAYSPSTSRFSIANDTLTAWSDARFASADIAQNSTCSLNAAGSTVITSGSTVRLQLQLTFKSGFTGKKNIYVNVWDQKGAASGFVAKGHWTVP